MIKNFTQMLQEHNIELRREFLSTLQVNMGKKCNQACHHCHVEAGPLRTENMNSATIDRILSLLDNAPRIQTVDITGGAPELNPHFRRFVSSIRAMNKQVIDRCNLTVLFEPTQEDTAAFLAEHQIEIVASLPCYQRENVDTQRGKGVFDKSIKALQTLNRLGYGHSDTNLKLNLVYNPVGVHLPPDQEKLEIDYKQQLQEDFDIHFNRLFTITNMPIKRFADYLNRLGKQEEYLQLLIDNFNLSAVSQVMCRQLVSIGWDGKIYDCDFNQMLEIPIGWQTKTVWDIDHFSLLNNTAIALKNHCYGCTAGAGSSCTGSLV